MLEVKMSGAGGHGIPHEVSLEYRVQRQDHEVDPGSLPYQMKGAFSEAE